MSAILTGDMWLTFSAVLGYKGSIIRETPRNDRKTSGPKRTSYFPLDEAIMHDDIPHVLIHRLGDVSVHTGI
jgi:hypothetical protein